MLSHNGSIAPPIQHCHPLQPRPYHASAWQCISSTVVWKNDDWNHWGNGRSSQWHPVLSTSIQCYNMDIQGGRILLLMPTLTWPSNKEHLWHRQNLSFRTYLYSKVKSALSFNSSRTGLNFDAFGTSNNGRSLDPWWQRWRNQWHECGQPFINGDSNYDNGDGWKTKGKKSAKESECTQQQTSFISTSL